jgi:hypothetical protein
MKCCLWWVPWSEDWARMICISWHWDETVCQLELKPRWHAFKPLSSRACDIKWFTHWSVKLEDILSGWAVLLDLVGKLLFRISFALCYRAWGDFGDCIVWHAQRTKDKIGDKLTKLFSNYPYIYTYKDSITM